MLKELISLSTLFQIYGVKAAMNEPFFTEVLLKGSDPDSQEKHCILLFLVLAGVDEKYLDMTDAKLEIIA